jgi:DNA-binding response OmpR family regulator
MSAILIVEDDCLLNDGLCYSLQKEGFTTLQAYTCREAEAHLEQSPVCLVLLDIRLPDASGLELCRKLRRTSRVPVIFLTANDTEQDIVKGFDTGADDYIAKPFSTVVLLRHIQAVLRRSGQESGPQVLHCGEIAIHPAGMKVYKRGEELRLTPTEYRLLAVLAENGGQVLTRELILQKLWDQDGNFVDENTLSVNIRRLRAKLEDDPKDCKYIKTVFGIGYTWGAGE